MFTSLSAGFQFAPSALSPPAAWPPADAPRFRQTSRLLHCRSSRSAARPQTGAADWPEATACGSSLAARGLFPEKRVKRPMFLFSPGEYYYTPLKKTKKSSMKEVIVHHISRRAQTNMKRPTAHAALIQHKWWDTTRHEAYLFSRMCLLWASEKQKRRRRNQFI